MSDHPTLAHLAALIDRLERDEARPHAELSRRDRPIGRALEPLRADPLAQLLGWLERVRDGEGSAPGRRLLGALRMGTLALVLLGLVLGWLTAAAVFYYDGSRPVNVIHGLAVFVGLQLLLLALLALALLPEKALGFLPGMTSLQEALRMLSPGRLQRLFVRFLPAKYRQAAASFIGRTAAHRALFGTIETWLIVRSGQAFGVAFNLGALAGCLYLIVFTDLAFGWSTTLQAQAQELQRITDALAWPWAWGLPQGRPSLELIEATRFFRLQPGTLPGAGQISPELLGGWWPFLILCILVYGLLPRLLLLLFAQARLKAVVRHTLLHLPGVGPLFDRLNSSLVQTQASEPEVGAVTEFKVAPAQQSRGELQGKDIFVIDWAQTGLTREALEGWLQSAWTGTLAARQEAGGARTLAQDRQLLAQVSAAKAEAVLVLVKGWEPPMAEFRDFLAELRQAAGKRRPLGIVPLGVGSSAAVLPAARETAEVWAATVAQLGDPWTFIAAVAPQGRD